MAAVDDDHPEGTIYLLHLDTPMAHMRHYLGFASDGLLHKRLASHGTAKGARSLQVARERGITWRLVRLWRGTRKDERRMKDWGGAVRYCPVCQSPVRNYRFVEELEITHEQIGPQGTGADQASQQAQEAHTRGDDQDQP